MTDEIGRLVGGLGIICGTVLVYLSRTAGGEENIGSDPLLVLIGMIAAIAGFAVYALGGERLERAAITASGAAAGLALLLNELSSRLEAGENAFVALLAIGIVVVGISAALVQWYLDAPSSPMAALAAGVSLVALLGNGASVALLFLAFGMIVTDVLGANDGVVAIDSRRPDEREYDVEAGDEIYEGEEFETEPRHDAVVGGRGGRRQSAPGDLAGSVARPDGELERHQDLAATPKPEHQPLPIAQRAGSGVAAEAARGASSEAGSLLTVSVLDDAYMTIGVAPKLLRSTDVSPPQVMHTAPAGHQFDGFRHGPFTIRAASHVGTKHMHGGQIRQDAYAVTRTRDDRFVIAAVADGVGSEAWSSLGAEWAVTSVVRNAVSKNDDDGRPPTGRRLAEIAAKEVGHMAHEYGYGTKVHEFSTTLVIAVVNTEDFKLELTRVGDSNAFTRQGSGWAGQFATDDEAGAATNAIPANKPDIETSETDLRPGGCLLLASDGIADLIANSEEVHRSLFDALAEPVAPLRFSSIAGFQRRQAHDDQTALAIWRGHGSGQSG